MNIENHNNITFRKRAADTCSMCQGRNFPCLLCHAPAYLANVILNEKQCNPDAAQSQWTIEQWADDFTRSLEEQFNAPGLDAAEIEQVRQLVASGGTPNFRSSGRVDMSPLIEGLVAAALHRAPSEQTEGTDGLDCNGELADME